MRKCDIIIPVYNAFECTKACIKSVLKNTDFGWAHLILIDDKSPDERVLPMLLRYQKQNPDRITVLKNEKNLGFVKTVNRGMKYSKSDVLLLNSDTEVTAGWLEKIQKCAYNGERIATVTPLSNNATLASVPKIFEKNELKGITLEKMGRSVEQCSLHLYPLLPTGHGFCLYIRRDALKEVGYFDEETFGKGYGEEVDFCWRCLEFGYRHLLCDDTYVLHKESQSFLGAKVIHDKELAEKHPKVKLDQDDWIKKRDIRVVGANVALAMGTMEKRPNILMVIHDWDEKSIGGTTLHTWDLIQNMRQKYNFHVLAPEGGLYKVHSYFRDSDAVTFATRRFTDISEMPLYSQNYGRMVEWILKEYHISLVHVQHLIGHYFDLGGVCKKAKVPYVVSLHDFYLKNAAPHLLDKRCIDAEKPAVNLRIWQEVNQEFLAGAQEIIVPSEFTRREFLKVYKNLKITVIPHGLGIEKNKQKHLLGERTKDIAFVGGIATRKGGKILEAMVKQRPSGMRVHLFGETDLSISPTADFIHHGKYRREDLSKLLREGDIDLVCSFSVAPETFCYTLEEVAAAGVPTVSFDIGAVPERIRKLEIGWVIKYTDDVEEIIEQIRRILDNREEYERVLKRVQEYKIKTVGQMAADYEKIYDRFVKPAKLDFKALQKDLVQADMILFGRNEPKKEENEINYKDEYIKVVNSLRWKIASKVRVPTGLGPAIKAALKK